MRFTALLVAASFAYSSAAMPAKLAVESQSFNSVGAATDNVQGIASGTAVGGKAGFLRSARLAALTSSDRISDAVRRNRGVFAFVAACTIRKICRVSVYSHLRHPECITSDISSCGISDFVCDQLSAYAFDCDSEADFRQPQCNSQRYRLGAFLHERQYEKGPRACWWHAGFSICVRGSSGCVRFTTICIRYRL
ncbi:hypothetical protein EDD15DRAFT_2302522 [Pisolithus albus]|nr:hypothetical protein EDD15DRAFT_2302522 [Pisolithus albus]